jgi:hypothetical protein
MVNITARQFSFRATALSSLDLRVFLLEPTGPLENCSEIREIASRLLRVLLGLYWPRPDVKGKKELTNI